MSYIDELTEKHGEHFVFSATGNGMRTACAEVDRMRERESKHAEKYLAEHADLRAQLAAANAECGERDAIMVRLESDLAGAARQIQGQAERLAVADAALAEAREENEVLSLAASELVKIAKRMTQDDGVDPEAWWIELSGEDANLVKLVAENVKRLEDDPTVEDGPNTAARRANFPQNYCKHGTLKGHCPMCE